jgi:hypothetical protein
MWQWRVSRTVKRQDEFRFGDRLYATLRWEGPFSRRAYARSPEGQWTYDRPRLLSRDVEIRAGKTLIAISHEKWTGECVIEFTDGRIFTWAPTNFWQTRWVFFDAEERPTIAFDDTSGLFEHTNEVTFWRSELTKADVGVLTTLGRYLAVLKRQDAAAIAAASTAAVVT